jgi:hypothetical protein
VAGVPSALILSAGQDHTHAGTAHSVHFAIVLIGLVGLVVVGLVQSRGHDDEDRADVTGRRSGSRPAPARHQARSMGSPAATGAVGVQTRTSERAWSSLWQTGAAVPTAERVVVPVALVSSAAAAGVHAAVGPQHFEEGALFGLFFVGSALLQLLWAGLVTVHRSKGLLVLGALGNLAVIGLWAVTRTVGLPFGLMPTPEAVGPWDVVCGLWELAVVASCLVLRRSAHTHGQVAPWRDWHRAAQMYAAGSLVLLVALSFTGASA